LILGEVSVGDESCAGAPPERRKLVSLPGDFSGEISAIRQECDQ
jgi:hypothetical protein